ncbi:MAG TPA: HIRAN domain-containing protein [Burkholderiales bacterium]|nr:HIRAN domain-containing protein [Burkholderiales bacterium]
MHAARVLFVFAALACTVLQAAQPTTRILIQSSPLAGFQFHEGKRLWEQLQVGDALMLVREPDNPHDSRAVRVHWNGHMLGYVPRAENDAVARQLDRGNKLEARIVRLTKHRDPWKRIEFEVFIRLQP